MCPRFGRLLSSCTAAERGGGGGGWGLEQPSTSPGYVTGWRNDMHATSICLTAKLLFSACTINYLRKIVILGT